MPFNDFEDTIPTMPGPLSPRQKSVEQPMVEPIWIMRVMGFLWIAFLTRLFS